MLIVITTLGPPRKAIRSFSREASYKFVPAEDDGIRILALFRYWNIIEYFFPYKHLFKEDWTNALKNFCHSLRPAALRLIIVSHAGG